MMYMGRECCLWDSVTIKINDDMGNYFRKGLRHGVPLSPIMFNIVAGMLDILVVCTKMVGQISGVISH